MIVTISASMKVYDEVVVIGRKLEVFGHTVHLPEPGERKGHQANWPEIKRRCIEIHLEKVRRSDALLVANIRQGDAMFGRVGASTFFEIGWAYALGKQIFVYEALDPDSPYTEDIMAIQPHLCDGDISKLKEV